MDKLIENILTHSKRLASIIQTVKTLDKLLKITIYHNEKYTYFHDTVYVELINASSKIAEVVMHNWGLDILVPNDYKIAENAFEHQSHYIVMANTLDKIGDLHSDLHKQQSIVQDDRFNQAIEHIEASQDALVEEIEDILNMPRTPNPAERRIMAASIGIHI